MTVSWDVAVDMNKVSYILYYMEKPFDFNAMSSAARRQLTPAVGDGYSTVWNHVNPDTALESFLPYRATITVPQGTTYDFVIRAIDSAGNEDSNQVAISAAIP